MRISLEGMPLYQWDTGRLMALTDYDEDDYPLGVFVGFATCDMRSAMRVAVQDGFAKVPDELLQTGIDVACWAEAGGRTLARATLRPTRRKKPAGYVSEPAEAETYDTMKAWVLERIEEAVGESVADYTALSNKPSIEGHVLLGDSSLDEIGVAAMGVGDIDDLFA